MSPFANRLAEPDRVRRFTSEEQLRQIDDTTAANIGHYASRSPAEIDERIEQLEREWGIERYLQLNVAAVGLSTAALAATQDRRWGWLTCGGLAFFLVHALLGFDPPLPLLRRRGIRTRSEINQEIHALKALRGDFRPVDDDRSLDGKIEAALRAVGLQPTT
ncbi:hypothetical protein [Opitutus terrae]|uniref:Transmembrane protein n=1 Tax=Opitutus terrae (strain DSM 11246 / JCM 15787 / PB90-1) TaxID=452637 RepID=B1ZSM3_OPITP|nr:hypothetical protein [Opitutus terrae]ACB73880.1 conserved hypothetical protein [Opitutus terrae PB90-1]